MTGVVAPPRSPASPSPADPDDGSRAPRAAEAPALTAPWCRATLAVGLLALSVRVAVVLVQGVVLRNDAADYQRLAVSLAGGHGFGTSHFAPAGGPTALRPPLFPLVLAGLYKVAGTHLLAARLAEAGLGAASVVLLLALTWLLWGRAVGLTAGVLAAVFPPQVMATTSLMSEALALPLELAALLAAVHYRRTGRLWWAAGSGAALGALVLTRPSLAVLAVPLVLLVGVTRLPRRPRRGLVAAAVLVLAGTVGVTPWLVRDRLAMHSWVPLTTQSGYVLSGTYNATAAHDRRHPAAWRPADLDPGDAALLAQHRRAGEVQVDALLQHAAFHYASAHPAYVATVAYENTRRLFDAESPAQVQADTSSEYGFPAPWGTADMVCSLGLAVLAAAGLLLRRGRRVPLAYLAAPALLWASTVVLQAVPRFRAVIDPFLLQLGAVAVVTAVTATRRRLGRRASA